MIADVKRTFYKIISPFRKLYWFLLRPKTIGVKCLIKYQDQFLFIRNTYGRMHWTSPGGGVHRQENPQEAVIREVSEEVGIIVQNPLLLGEYQSNREYKQDTVYCYFAEVGNADFNIDPSEIMEAKWMILSEIPEFQSPAVQKVLALYRNKLGHQS